MSNLMFNVAEMDAAALLGKEWASRKLGLTPQLLKVKVSGSEVDTLSKQPSTTFSRPGLHV